MTGTSTTWQLPAADDISSDSLEYLFSTTQPERRNRPPWVEMVVEPVARPSPELIRLQAKVEILAGEVDLLSDRLQSANCLIGYLQAQLAERETLLRSLPQFRLSAARAMNSYKAERSNKFRMPMDLIIYASMLAFAWAVLMSLLA